MSAYSQPFSKSQMYTVQNGGLWQLLEEEYAHYSQNVAFNTARNQARYTPFMA